MTSVHPESLLRRLSDRGSVSMLAEHFPVMTRQAVTKHLRVRAAAGVINRFRRGREHVWAINPTRVAEGRRRLELIGRGWDDVLARLKNAS